MTVGHIPRKPVESVELIKYPRTLFEYSPANNLFGTRRVTTAAVTYYVDGWY